MKNASLALLFFTAVLFPSLSHAQLVLVPFGGRDVSILAMCTCTPTLPVLTCAEPTPEPPTYIFHLFAPLWIGTAAPIGGFLAMLIEEPGLLFPSYALRPGSWALGKLIPTPPNPLTTCGIYIPFPPLLALCASLPGYAPEGVVGVCVPTIPAIGVVTPSTGTALDTTSFGVF